MILTNGLETSSTLISIMPRINQLWTTFTENVDGWTIPVSGQIILIELHPKDEYVKSTIRKELAKITVYLEYTDIYNTNFQDERKLDFLADIIIHKLIVRGQE